MNIKQGVVIVACTLLLAACGSPIQDGVAQPDGDAPLLRTFYVKTIDGRTIPCVYGSLGYGAGLSCGWDTP